MFTCTQRARRFGLPIAHARPLVYTNKFKRVSIRHNARPFSLSTTSYRNTACVVVHARRYRVTVLHSDLVCDFFGRVSTEYTASSIHVVRIPFLVVMPLDRSPPHTSHEDKQLGQNSPPTTSQEGQENLQIDSVNAVNRCKLPPFWVFNPRMWLTHAEAVFSNHGIRADNTKYNHIIEALGSDILCQLCDVVELAPSQDKYSYLKEQIIARFTDPPDTQLNHLLNNLRLDDKKPSHLLRQMRSLAKGMVSEDTIRVKWLSLLPDNVQRMLKLTKNTPLDNQAAIADEIMDIPPSTSTVFAVAPSSQPQVNPQASDLTNLMERNVQASERVLDALAELNRGMKSLLQSNNRRSSRSPHTRSSSRSPSRRPSAICFYHSKHGLNARNCKPPCAFPSPSVASVSTGN